MTSPIEETQLSQLPTLLDRLGSRRVLILTGPSRRFLERLEPLLDSWDVEVFSGARRHVPVEVVEQAEERLREHRADTVISLGGGSTTGLAKALRLQHDVRFIAIPTTYSGSERTNIHGTTSARGKVTGREDRVRPDAILYDPTLTVEMPKRLTITSLLNALAHVFGALLKIEETGAERVPALDAIDALYASMELLLRAPRDVAGRGAALTAAATAADLLQGGTLGPHHKLAHWLGGRFHVDHAGLHSVLLPHTVHQLRSERPELVTLIEQRLQVADVEGSLFDFLVRAGAKTSLGALGIEEPSCLEAAKEAALELDPDLLHAALYGRRPSAFVRRVNIGLDYPVSVWGSFDEAQRVIVALHGRGSNADAAIGQVVEMLGHDSATCIVAPQARASRWYEGAYNQPTSVRAAQVASSSEVIDQLLAFVTHRTNAPLCLYGFSQGACLALHYLTHGEVRVAKVCALSGAHIWIDGEPKAIERRLGGAVFLGVSEQDNWIRKDDVERSALDLRQAGASVQLRIVAGGEHRAHALHRRLGGEFLNERPGETLSGFGSFHETEALPNALPIAQNSPRLTEYFLYPEQINGTGFTVPRAENRRSWTYRIRPAAQHTDFEPWEHPTLCSDFLGKSAEVNLRGWGPLPLPSEPTDFVDGLSTLGGAGHPSLGRGYAVHRYAANRSMEDRAFANADGELLLLPEMGSLCLTTEFGIVDAKPGQLVVIPRGVRFSVLLETATARGFVAEVFGRQFHLPERGPVGANGLVDARHFRSPAAWYEDRLCPGYQLITKLGGNLFRAVQDYSPYDVVAWHGNLVPYRYDLSLFSPVGNTLIDHGDPSIYTVLSVPLDEPGNHLLDLVVFPPRWDATEHTFRPPFFHRNATTELNGIIKNPVSSSSRYCPGTAFLTPSMTPHGIGARGVRHAIAASDRDADRPIRMREEALWFQFESALPFVLSPTASEAAQADWSSGFGAYRTHFRPGTRRGSAAD